MKMLFLGGPKNNEYIDVRELRPWYDFPVPVHQSGPFRLDDPDIGLSFRVCHYELGELIGHPVYFAAPEGKP
jgi:hypothetical protein